MTARKRVFSLTLACLLSLSTLSFPVQAANKNVQEARNGVVRVICVPENSDVYYKGSGFAVGRAGSPVSYFVTNHHVIEEDPERVYLVLDEFTKQGTLIPATVVAASESPDLAILQIDTPISDRIPLPLLSATEVEVTEQVYTIGFPGVADNVNDEGKRLPSTPDDVTVTAGTVTKQQVSLDGMDCIQTDATIHGGNSGGPLVTEDGAVVGINTFSANNQDGTQASGTNFAVFVDYVIQYLQSQNIPFESAAAGSGAGDPAGSSPGSGPASDQPAESVPSSGGETSSGMGDALYIALGAAVLVVGIVAIFVLKKKKPAPIPAAAPPPPSSPPAAPAPPSAPAPAMPTLPLSAPISSGPKLYCSGGFLKGNTFDVGSGVTLGRDPSRCNVVFPKETPGISSVHCSVQANGSTVYLVDKGSSYGTFLANGQKLSPNQPVQIRSGDGFYLASQGNFFQLL